MRKYAAVQAAAPKASRVPSRSKLAPAMSTTSTRPAIARTEPARMRREGARRVRTHASPTSKTGAKYWMSRAIATGIRCRAAK